MASRVVLHIGTMKSGSSYLQTLLFAQRAQLAEAGVLVPGANRSQQIVALRQGRARRGPKDAWLPMAAGIAAHDGVVVLSSETLGASGPRAAKQLLPDLEPAPVDVVVTARDLNRMIVSMWQETVQNGRSWTWADYLAGVRDAAPYGDPPAPPPDTPGRTFWKQQDLARIVREWTRHVGAERITVVTVPHPGADRTVLAARFVEATGVPVDPSLPSPRTNASLGLASVLAIRQVNELLDAQGHQPGAGWMVRKRLVAKKVLAELAADEPRLGLEVAGWVREQSAATVEALRSSGVRLVGDWADLEPVPAPGVAPEDVDPALVARAAVTGLAAVTGHMIDKGLADEL